MFKGRPKINVTSVTGFDRSFDSVAALPAVIEKGYIDVHLSVKLPSKAHGGNSCFMSTEKLTHVSFRHIGLLAAFITEIGANPISRKLSQGTLFLV